MIKFTDFANPTVGLSNETTRQQWLKRTLKNIPKGAKILDAGAGEQQFKKYCKHLKYISQDIAEYDGKGNDKGLQTKKWDFGKLDIISDITDIPRPDKSFDAIMCTEVFEHIPDPIKAFDEFKRLLKPKGDLIITAPFASLTHFAPYHYYTGFNTYFYQHHLERLGFEIIEIKRNGNYFDYLGQEFQRLPVIGSKYTGKSMNLIEKVARLIVLNLLSKYASSNSGSEELLCFGVHVWARKK